MTSKKRSVLGFVLLLIVASDAATVQAAQLTALQQQALAQTSDWILQQAFNSRRSGLQVQGQGKIYKLLSDDNQGGKHQRFLIRLGTGQSLLVAHNIDIAPRVANLQIGRAIAFYGQYEWNSQGGLIHWTHRDPSHRHVNGWLKYTNKIYQ
jgi:hypothetical protein